MVDEMIKKEEGETYDSRERQLLNEQVRRLLVLPDLPESVRPWTIPTFLGLVVGFGGVGSWSDGSEEGGGTT